jgi:hypothetical protein
LKGNSQVTILKMRKIFIPETSLILELTYESFWCLVKNVEEKLVFQAQDQTFYYFSNSDMIFYTKKIEGENSGCLPPVHQHIATDSFKSGLKMGSWGSPAPATQPTRNLQREKR